MKWFFSDAIRTTVGSSPVRILFCDSVHQNFFESSNDCGYLLIPSNTYTPAANRLYYFDNIIKGRVRRKMICLQTDQGNVMRFFYSDRPAYLLVVTCHFLLCFTKTKVLDRGMYHTQTCVKRWDNLYTTNKRRLSKFRRQRRLLTT